MSTVDPKQRIVVVGAGHAGDAVVGALRQAGHAGPLTLVGDEPFAPYQRPPLSKAWLKGEINESKLELRSAEVYQKLSVDLRLGVPAEAIKARRLVLADGTALDWDRLILATGARARTLPIPGATLGGVLALRSRADADALKAVIRPGARIVLVGGGYIGLEIAASATALGASVTVLEREARLLARVASQPLAGFFLERHRRAGVDIVLDARVTAIEGEGGRAAGVRLGNGTLLPADAVVIGVGAVPNDELGRAAGLACEDGIVVDERAATSDTAIFGIGDCTRRPVPRYGRSLRLESVPSAIEQGKQAAAAIMGRPAPVPEVPWFWSDQYEVRLQIAGLQLDVARTLLRGDPATGRFAVFHLAADGVIQAVEAVNAPEEYMAGRLLIGRRTVVAADRLADAGIRMKDLMAG